jgi:hypothetical protein
MTAAARVFTGSVRSGTTERLLGATADILGEGRRGHALVIVSTRLARVQVALRLRALFPGCMSRTLVCCAAGLERFLVPPHANRLAALQAAGLWNELRDLARTDLNTATLQAGLDVPPPLLAKKRPRAATAPPSMASVTSSPHQQLAGIIAEMVDVVAVDDLETGDDQLAELLEAIACHGTTLLASYHPDMWITTNYRSADPLALAPTLADNSVTCLSHDGPGPLRLAHAVLVGPTSVSAAGYLGSDDGVERWHFASESAARLVISERLATQRPEIDARGQGPFPGRRIEPGRGGLLHDNDTAAIILLARNDGAPLLRAARQQGLALRDATGHNRLAAGTCELYQRFLYGGRLPLQRDFGDHIDGQVLSTFADRVVVIVGDYLHRHRTPVFAREQIEVFIAVLSAMAAATPLLERPAADAPVPTQGLRALAQAMDSDSALAEATRTLLEQWAEFELHRSNTAERVRWLGRKIERQLPTTGAMGSRLHASPAAQMLLAADCPRDARAAAVALWRAAHLPPALPSIAATDAVLLIEGDSCHGLSFDVVLVWGTSTRTEGAEDDAGEQRRRLSLAISRARRHVVLVTWGSQRSDPNQGADHDRQSS